MRPAHVQRTSGSEPFFEQAVGFQLILVVL